jgi:hypothetical protein
MKCASLPRGDGKFFRFCPLKAIVLGSRSLDRAGIARGMCRASSIMHLDRPRVTFEANTIETEQVDRAGNESTG